MFTFTTFSEVVDFIENHVDNPKYLSCIEAGVWKSFSSKEFVNHVHLLAAGFASHGIKAGTTVAIVSDSSPYWLMIDYALQYIGATSVPIFANIASENLHYEIEDSQIEYMFIASNEKYEQIKDVADQMRLVVTKDVSSSAKNSVTFEDFLLLATDIPQHKPNPDDIATIIYTSGSTGRPKGVELTHANFISQLNDTHVAYELFTNDKALSFLPLAHIFERMVVSYYLVCGISIYFADDVKNVGNLIKDIKPNLMTVVPRLLDKIFTKMHIGASEAKGIKWLIAHFAYKRADTKHPESPKTFMDKLYAKLVYGKLLDALGGNMRMMICGGAPLDKKVEQFFTNIGLDLYQGYGLSETSPVICANSPAVHKFGTAGKPFSSVQVKLLPDGELLAKGPNVMKGYHGQIEKTAETIENGWIHTGDLAEIDEEGFITIKSRKKELFKTSTGKYVSAIAIEQAITQSKWVDYSVIIADNRPFVTALIFLDPLLVDAYAKRKKLNLSTFEEQVKDPNFTKLMNRTLDKINSHLSKWEKVQKFVLVGEVPTIESHILTPSMKVSRNKAYEKYEKEINLMYGDEK
ncbi:MAG: AMP-binding protein [Thiovulaceae bacterium]|nr:AMP-binding protein [Sulfurimonadaceae bacterium]